MSTVLILNYQKRSHAWILRRWAWRLLFLCLLVAAFASWRNRAWLSQHARFLYFSWRCERFAAPGHLAAIRPGDNVWPLPQNAALLPDCWQQLELLMGDQPSPPGQSILFLHQRTSPAGHRRLVALEVLKDGQESALQCSVVALPGLLSPWKPPHFAWRDACNHGAVVDIVQAIAQLKDISSANFVEIGQPDPADPAHFTIPFTIAGIQGNIDGTLQDDDTIQLRIRDASVLAHQLRNTKMNVWLLTGQNLDDEIIHRPQQKWGLFSIDSPILPTDDDP